MTRPRAKLCSITIRACVTGFMYNTTCIISLSIMIGPDTLGCNCNVTAVAGALFSRSTSVKSGARLVSHSLKNV